MSHLLAKVGVLLRAAFRRDELPPPPDEGPAPARGLLDLLLEREPLPFDPVPARSRGEPMEHARHVVRVVLVVVAALALVLVGRGLLVPRSYGAHGPYRFDNVREQMEVRAPAHAGPAACGECHPDEAARRAAGSHKAVSCEVCHGPLRRHVKPDGVVTAPAVDRSPALCARCHRKLEGRPARFPQVVLEEHVPGPLEERACLGCHDPHAPKP